MNISFKMVSLYIVLCSHPNHGARQQTRKIFLLYLHSKTKSSSSSVVVAVHIRYNVFQALAWHLVAITLIPYFHIILSVFEEFSNEVTASEKDWWKERQEEEGLVRKSRVGKESSSL